jgi:hypothetical protein
MVRENGCLVTGALDIMPPFFKGTNDAFGSGNGIGSHVSSVVQARPQSPKPAEPSPSRQSRDQGVHRA